jgi:hypothetical protein
MSINMKNANGEEPSKEEILAFIEELSVKLQVTEGQRNDNMSQIATLKSRLAIMEGNLKSAVAQLNANNGMVDSKPRRKAK